MGSQSRMDRGTRVQWEDLTVVCCEYRAAVRCNCKYPLDGPVDVTALAEHVQSGTRGHFRQRKMWSSAWEMPDRSKCSEAWLDGGTKIGLLG